MIRPIMKDPIFLAQKSAPATVMDLPIAQDLRDTLEAHRDGCVGMAANMIGAAKRIIIFDDNGSATVMFNPEIVKSSGIYEAEEGCLSLSGTRKTKRYRSIKVQYQNEKFETRLKTYAGFTAQIIQHEIDHCNGVLV
ncbi:MAG: peptide deformylase [Oscillospiraceae bacterium]|nr:peptide deformylase [Oscillospiraceae bacterium]